MPDMQFEIILLPQNKKLRKRLNLKLDEYKKRYEEGKRISTKCKMMILDRLLKHGKVSTALFSRIDCHASVFNNAFMVIEDYCKTGGKNVCGGTGLPNI